MYPGLWAVGSLHSTATLSIQSAPTACMGLGSCTVPIFPSPTTATRLAFLNIPEMAEPCESNTETPAVPDFPRYSLNLEGKVASPDYPNLAWRSTGAMEQK
ncbi:hypothetical protein DFH06DRAFT_1299107 [Mycena polygramma]|nr:hypothetical protein DFH06DRAFT_1299107 [Mycena polygramma]